MRDLPVGRMLRVFLDGEPVLLANVEGTVFAVGDRCTHEDASLFKGRLSGTCVRCPLHGSRFDLRTGEPLEEPAVDPVPIYQVRIDKDAIFLAPA